jgi:hypothetical protein
MKIPSLASDKQDFLRFIVDGCMASQQERKAQYEKRRRYFLYGQNEDVKVKFNRLKAHMKLVSSFLFSSEGLVYNIAPPKNADEAAIQQFLALQDDFNEDIHDSGIADVVADAVIWALNFDTMIVKLGWNDITGQAFASLVEPSCFGVWREDDPSFASQPAMNHSYLLDYDEACRRLKLAGREDSIALLQVDGQPGETGQAGYPEALGNIIVAAVTGNGLTGGDVAGATDMNYEPSPMFRARLDVPMVRFNETWIWDTDAEDYRIFHSLDAGILLSDSRDTIEAIKKAGNSKAKYDSTTNWYLAKQNPFVPFTPLSLYNYFWGDAHMEDIIPLQNWSTKRLREIDEILEAQVDPLRTTHGMEGLTDEKADLDYGAWYSDDSPSSKLEEHRPPMPEDAFREFNEIGMLMMEASGLTETVSGKGSGGARGGQQQKQMQITGGGTIRKTAVGLEKPLVRLGDIALRLKMKNDDSKIRLPSGSDFVAAQVPDNFSVRVDGHSHSPLFTLENRELATLLFKAQAIDQEWLLRMTNPTQRQNLLHSLRMRKEAQAKAEQQRLAMGMAEPKGKK